MKMLHFAEKTKVQKRMTEHLVMSRTRFRVTPHSIVA